MDSMPETPSAEIIARLRYAMSVINHEAVDLDGRIMFKNKDDAEACAELMRLAEEAADRIEELEAQKRCT